METPVRPTIRPLRIDPRDAVWIAALVALFVLLPDVSLSGDMLDAPRRAITGELQPSNAATSALHVALHRWIFDDPIDAVRAVTYAAGAVGALCAIALARELFDDTPRRVAATLLFLTTGSAALFFGSVEVYAPLGAAVLGCLLAGVRLLRGRGGVAAASLACGTAFVLHGSAGLLIPSLAFAAWRAEGRRGVAVAAGLFLVPVAITIGGLLAGPWRSGIPGAGPALWGNFLGAEGNGPLLALRNGAGNFGERYALFDAQHAVGVLRVVVIAAPVAWGLLLASALTRRTATPATDRPLVAFAALALVPWLLFATFWNVSYAMSRDWDLFSAAGAPAALLASILWLRHANDRSAAARVAALCVAWFAPFVALHAGTRTERREFATMAVSLVGSPLGGDAASAARGPAAAAWDARIRELDTTGAAAAIDEGDALAVAGRTDDARRAYERALAAEPDNHAARLCLGQLAYRDGRRDDAARLLRAIPDDARDRIVASARMVLGQIALDAGDAAAAARLLDEAIRGASWLPKAPAAARLYAEACRRLGRADDAVAAERWADRRAPR